MAYHVIEGKVVGKKEKIGIVCARFNEFIVSKLLGGAVDGLVRHGISEENIDVAWVPGAFEIPLICEKMVKTGKYDAVIIPIPAHPFPASGPPDSTHQTPDSDLYTRSSLSG